MAGFRFRGGGSQGLILSPVRRVPRPLRWFDRCSPAPQRSSCVYAERPGAGRLQASCHLHGGGIVPPLRVQAIHDGPPSYLGGEPP